MRNREVEGMVWKRVKDLFWEEGRMSGSHVSGVTEGDVMRPHEVRLQSRCLEVTELC